MPDWNKVMVGIGGALAGYGGTGPQYMQMMQYQREAEEKKKQQQQADREAKMDEFRRNVANEFVIAQQSLQGGDVQDAANRLKQVASIPLLGNSPVGQQARSVLQDLTRAQGPGQDPRTALESANKKLEMSKGQFITKGLLQPGQQAEPLNRNQITDQGQVVMPTPGGGFAATQVEGFTPSPADSAQNRASAISRAYDNGSTLKVLPDGTTEVTDPSGRVVDGAERVKVLEQARQEQIEFAIKRAEAQGIGSGNVERMQSTINEGLDLAQGSAVLRRSIDLLNEVQTGGLNAVALKAKQFFGVEGADEGELTSNLGRAVLSQLRSTFGAQFTEREGARLEAIEANIGRNPASNIRILSQLLTVIERDAERAIDAAISIKDFRTADEIQELLEFRLTDETGGEQSTTGTPTVTTQQEYDALPSGAIFIEDGKEYKKP